MIIVHVGFNVKKRVWGEVCVGGSSWGPSGLEGIGPFVSVSGSIQCTGGS